MSEDAAQQRKGDFLRLFGYVRPYLWSFLLAVLLTAMVGVLEAVVTALVVPMVDMLNAVGQSTIPVAGRFDIGALLRDIFPSGSRYWIALAATLVVVTACKGIAEYAANMLMTKTGLRVVVQIRCDLYNHVIRQSPEFFQKYPSSSLLAHITNDTEKVQLGVSYLIADLLREGFTCLGMLVLVFTLNWRLTFVFLAVGPLIYLVTVNLGKRLRRRSNAALRDMEAMLEVAQESFTGITIVKAFGAEAYENRRFAKTAKQLARSLYRAAAANFLSSPLLEMIGISAIALFLIYAQAIVASNEMTAGALVGWIVAVLRLYDPVRRLSRVQNQFQQAFAASERLFTILDMHTEQQDAVGAVDLPPLRERIEFRGVSFHYPESENHALDRIDLTIESGEIVALVGRSGAGKSTLANLLLRLVDPTEGRVLVDGIDIRQATLASLRRQIALVTQETILFNDTIRANIAYGRDDLDVDAVRAAATAAHADGFIAERPEGYDAEVGERGSRLSGGQRQRIAIARAILKDAPILILDEATSALDSHSEREVQRALANLMQSRTTLVIAHRLSTVQHADKIVVLEAGRIVEVGTHDQLIQRNGLYRSLYEMQGEPVASGQ